MRGATGSAEHLCDSTSTCRAVTLALALRSRGALMASFSSPWSLELALLLLEISNGIDCVIPEELDGPAVDLLQAYRLHLLE